MVLMLRIASIFGFLTASSLTCVAYTPDDPIVQEMVNRGVKYLESTVGGKTHFETGKAHLGGWGEWALAGYAHYKVEHNPDSNVVKKGIEGAVGIANGLNEKRPEGHTSQTNYNLGVAALLLSEVDRDKYRKELDLMPAICGRPSLVTVLTDTFTTLWVIPLKHSTRCWRFGRLIMPG